MKYLISLCLAILQIANLHSQDQCGFDQVYNEQGYFVKPFGFTQQIDLDTAEVLIIPLVVHIIHLGEEVGEGTNISNEQIQSAIVALNDDFRKVEGTNGDGLGVDTKIEFCLASRDPNNTPTDGIIRTDGRVVEGYEEMGVKSGNIGVGADESDLKDLVAWPREDYLNIFVVSEIDDNDGGGGTQGYAYFPFDDVRYGTVILYNAFGTVGNLKGYTDLNRVLTHEIGHCFKLYHTFYNTSNCLNETNCVTQGDQVCDTPSTTSNSTCSGAVNCPDAQIENYMDYTDETCRNTFTEGQALRMRDAIEFELPSLLESIACNQVYAIDLATTDVRYPEISCTPNIDVEVDITNYGANLVTPILVNINDEYYSWTDDLLYPGQTITILIEDVNIESSFSINVEVSTTMAYEPYLDNNEVLVYSEYESNSDEITVNIQPDVFYTELSFYVLDDSGEYLVYPTELESADPLEINFCVFEGCYHFVMEDAYGDGIQYYGEYTITTSNNVEIFYYEGIPLQESSWFSVLDTEICFPFPCLGDYDEDGVVDVRDLLILLENMMLDEGFTQTDLLNFLQNYSMDCETGEFLQITQQEVNFPTNIIEDKYTYIQGTKIFNLLGREINDKARLTPGIYLVIEIWSDGQTKTRKIFVNP
jgi:hypothetical protein